MAPSLAELALGSAPARPTPAHVAGLVEADLAKRAIDREERARELAARDARARAARQRDAARVASGASAAIALMHAAAVAAGKEGSDG